MLHGLCLCVYGDCVLLLYIFMCVNVICNRSCDDVWLVPVSCCVFV